MLVFLVELMNNTQKYRKQACIVSFALNKISHLSQTWNVLEETKRCVQSFCLMRPLNKDRCVIRNCTLSGLVGGSCAGYFVNL